MKFNLWSEYPFRRLWYFIAFVFGVALYFGLSREPNWMMCLGLGSVLGLLAYFKRSIWVKLVLFFVLGLCVATIRTHFVHTDFLRVSQYKQEISGQVIQSFVTHKGQMIVLDVDAMPKARFVPKRVRLSWSKNEPKFHVGDRILCVGNLHPPAVFQAQRFFYQGLAAQGKITSILKRDPNKVQLLDRVREYIISRLKKSLTVSQAEIAIPLIVGEQGVVSRQVYDVYRKAGIAHVLSVSGFHMMLLAGFIFFLVRGLLALFPYVALRLPTKKIAAILAFFVTGFYLLISGMQIPAIRSFMMISVVFLGVLVDRKTVSLYTLFLVACCFLLLRPEWITSVSFQFSFVAVMVLVGAFEDVSKVLPRGLFCRVIVTAVIANVFVTLALAPFVVYHFNQFNPYGVIGNLFTSTLFSFLIMPLLFLGTVLMPFSCEGPVLKLTGLLLDIVNTLARWVAELPRSEIIMSSFSGYGLGIITFGLVVVCVMKTKWRLVGFAFVLMGICVGYGVREMPDIIVDRKGAGVLVRNSEGQYLSKGKISWQMKRLLRQNGQKDAESMTNQRMVIRSMVVAFDETFCEGAKLAVLKKPTDKCKAEKIWLTNRGEIYQIFLQDPIVINNVADENLYRPWRLNFKRKEKNEK